MPGTERNAAAEVGGPGRVGVGAGTRGNDHAGNSAFVHRRLRRAR